MRTFLSAAAIAIGLAATLPAPASAGAIERACMNSGRAAANRALCGCIQQVADMTLSWRDQRLAAKFFRDPDRSQEIRQSDSRRHEVFWKKYRQFGSNAESYCR